MILLVDNYDSFVYNLARYITELGGETIVVRNDACSLDELQALRPRAVVLSPGPCTPRESGLCLPLIRQWGATVPMLGVCLGHQAMAYALGGRVIRAPEPVHGRVSAIRHDGDGLFAGLPQPLNVTRYHSLLVDEATLPADLRITARTADGLPMALAHRRWPLWGVQFHPEAVLTEAGHALLANFLRLAGLEATLPLETDRQPAHDGETVAEPTVVVSTSAGVPVPQPTPGPFEVWGGPAIWPG